ncbi:MAG: hypothetical protein L3J99_06250 [Thermoplasmata archaeon]|nr:hypothetical protein [Thermoplasmata archaeon]
MRTSRPAPVMDIGGKGGDPTDFAPRGPRNRSHPECLRTILSVSVCALLLALFLGTGPFPSAAAAAVPVRDSLESSRTLEAPAASQTSGGTVVVFTDDTHSLHNTALRSSFVLPSTSSLGTGTIDVWLLEPLTDAQEVGVGVEFNSSMGSVRANAEWGEWNTTGSRFLDLNRSLTLPVGVPTVLSIAWEGGVGWGLTANGLTIPSTPGGEVRLGVGSAEGLASLSSSGLPYMAPSIVVNSSGPLALPQFDWLQAFAIGPTTTPLLPGDGIIQHSGNAWGVQGQNQHLGVGPDTFIESTSLPKVPNGTYAWGIGNVDFPPLAAWTSEDPQAFSTTGTALNITVPGGVGASGSPVGICQELLEPLANGPWITVGACWVGGVGIRAYMAVTQADGAVYQKLMFAPLPSAGARALFVVRDQGNGTWMASINGHPLADAQGNRSIDGGSDRSNGTLGPYGALRGDAAADLPTVVNVPQAVLVFPTGSIGTSILPPGGRIAPSDGRPPALVTGHLQNASLPPGSIQVFAGRSPLPFETPLWNEARLPDLQVTSPAKLRATHPWEPQGFPVSVRTSSGEPVAEARIEFSMPPGAGSVEPTVPMTGLDGTVWVVWYPPADAGTWSVTITAAQENFTRNGATVTLVLDASSSAAWAEVVLPVASLGVALLGALLISRRRE